MIEVVPFTYSDTQWNKIKAVVQKARNRDADEIVLESTSMDGTKHDVTLRTEIEGTARLHLARDKVMRSLPTQMEFREHLSGLREDAECLRNGIVGSRAFWSRHNDYAPDKDMLVATDAYFEKLLRNLDGIIAALGPPRKKTGGTASTNLGRNLFWSGLLAIWCQIGGETTCDDIGNAEAFLRAVSVPVFNAMPKNERDGVPNPKSVKQWLRRSITNTKVATNAPRILLCVCSARDRKYLHIREVAQSTERPDAQYHYPRRDAELPNDH